MRGAARREMIEALGDSNPPHMAEVIGLAIMEDTVMTSLYEIPDGCICLGDGLMGMKCTAKEHARLKGPQRGERLPEPVTLLDKAVRELSDIAMSVTHHDIDPSEPEAVHEMLSMERRFRPVLRRFLTKKSVAIMKPPKELDTITDVVLRYKPPEKVKATNRRAKRKAKRDAKKKDNYTHVL